jgi:hypothetical protein
MPPTKKATTKKPKTDEEDSEDKPDDETAEGEDSGDETPAQRREQAFRDMINKKRGKK